MSALPVLDRYGGPVGVLSTRDILKAESGRHGPRERDRLFDETMVLEIMAPWPVTIPPNSDVRDAAREMLYLEVQRVLVEDKGALIGVISRLRFASCNDGARWLLKSTAPRRYGSRLSETGAPACPGLAVAPAGGGAY